MVHMCNGIYVVSFRDHILPHIQIKWLSSAVILLLTLFLIILAVNIYKLNLVIQHNMQVILELPQLRISNKLAEPDQFYNFILSPSLLYKNRGLFFS